MPLRCKRPPMKGVILRKLRKYLF